MFGTVTLSAIVAVLIVVLFVMSTVSLYAAKSGSVDRRPDGHGDGGGESRAGGSNAPGTGGSDGRHDWDVSPREQSSQGVPGTNSRMERSPYEDSGDGRRGGSDPGKQNRPYAGREASVGTVGGAPTTKDSKHNHYRSESPFSGQPARDPTPVDALTEHDGAFRRYAELGESERKGIADPGNVTISVATAVLDPLLRLIEKNGRVNDPEGGGGGGAAVVKTLIVYFNKANDSQLSLDVDRTVRKSLKIHHRKFAKCRYARMWFKLQSNQDGTSHYDLTMHDYTPYMEEHAPRFDPFFHTVSNDSAQWTAVEATVTVMSRVTEIKTVSVLVPKK